jgi:hypothetical protein
MSRALPTGPLCVGHDTERLERAWQRN